MEDWDAAIESVLAILLDNGQRGDCANWIRLLSEDRDYPFKVWRAMWGMGSLGDIVLDDHIQNEQLNAARDRLQELAGAYLIQHKFIERG